MASSDPTTAKLNTSQPKEKKGLMQQPDIRKKVEKAQKSSQISAKRKIAYLKRIDKANLAVNQANKISSVNSELTAHTIDDFNEQLLKTPASEPQA